MPFDAAQNDVNVAPIPVLSGWLGSWHLSVTRRPYAPEELAGQYDRESQTWHTKIRRLGFENAYRHLLAKVLRQDRYAQPSRPLRVLDAGIGTGAMSLALCDTIDQPIHLDGVDISPEMLSQTAKRLGGRGIDVTLRQTDLEALPFEDNRFDIIMAAHVLEHLANPERAISELFRVLKPGGVIILCITRRSSAGAYIQILWRTHRVAVKPALRWLRGGGFQSVRAVPLDKQTVTRKLSVGYVGRKPLEAPA